MTMAFMFGDNKLVVMTSTIPQSILNKRHNMTCSSGQNRRDILSKHWDYKKVKDTERELIDYQGDSPCKT